MNFQNNSSLVSMVNWNICQRLNRTAQNLLLHLHIFAYSQEKKLFQRLENNLFFESMKKNWRKISSKRIMTLLADEFINTVKSKFLPKLIQFFLFEPNWKQFEECIIYLWIIFYFFCFHCWWLHFELFWQWSQLLYILSDFRIWWIDVPVEETLFLSFQLVCYLDLWNDFHFFVMSYLSDLHIKLYGEKLRQ